MNTVLVFVVALASVLVVVNATTYVVHVGWEDNISAGHLEGLRFYPDNLTISVDDTVSFTWVGAHNVYFSPDLVYPNPSAPLTDVTFKDPEFSTIVYIPQVDLIVPPGVFSPLFPPNFNLPDTINSTSDEVSTGLFGIPFVPGCCLEWNVTFTAAGTYNYYCILHPGMAGVINVVEGEGDDPVAVEEAAVILIAEHKANAAEMVAEAIANRPDPVINASGNALHTVWSVLNAFVPATLIVNVGDSVIFINPDFSVHNLGFNTSGVFNGADPDFETPNVPWTFGSGCNPCLNYPSAYPDGFAGPGFMLPGQNWTISFDTPGDYPYECYLHGIEAGLGMAGTISVRVPTPPPTAGPSPSGPSPSGPSPSGPSPSPTTTPPATTPASAHTIVISFVVLVSLLIVVLLF